MTSKQKKFVDILFRALQRADYGSFDYLSFRKKLKEKDALEEPERYRQAFKEVGGWSAGTDSARKAVETAVEALIGETEKFKEVLRKQKIEKVDPPQDRMVQIRKAIQHKQQEIARLEEEYQRKEAEAEAAAGNIQQTAADFREAYQQMIHQVKTDLDKMNQYLSD